MDAETILSEIRNCEQARKDAAWYKKAYAETDAENEALRKVMRRTYNVLTLVGVVDHNYDGEALDIDGGEFAYRVYGDFGSIQQGDVVLIVGRIMRLPGEANEGVFVNVELLHIEVLNARTREVGDGRDTI